MRTFCLPLRVAWLGIISTDIFCSVRPKTLNCGAHKTVKVAMLIFMQVFHFLLTMSI